MYNHPVGKILQYEDTVGEAILKTYAFLQDLSRSQVDEVLNREQKQFQCEFCDSSFDVEIALKGHMRKHKDEILTKEKPLDPSIVPIAEGNQVESIYGGPQMQRQANPQYNTPIPQFRGDETTGDEFVDMGSSVSRKKGL